MNITFKYSPEIKERSVRLMQEHRSEYPSLWATIESIVPKIGYTPPTLHDWVKKHGIDTGLREGITSGERERTDALKHLTKNSSLAKSHTILKRHFQKSRLHWQLQRELPKMLLLTHALMNLDSHSGARHP